MQENKVFKPNSSLQAGLVKAFPEANFDTANVVSEWEITRTILILAQREYERLERLEVPVEPKQQLEIGAIEIYDERWEQAKANVLRPLVNEEYNIQKKYIYEHIQDHLVLAADNTSV